MWWISNRSASRRASFGAKARSSDAVVCAFRLSITSTIFSAVGWTSSANRRSTSAKSFAVRRSVTVTLRRPARGSEIMNGLAVPLRTDSESNRSGRPGSAGTGSAVSPINCSLASSGQTSGRFGSGGRWYTSNTSSIAQTNSAFCSGGRHHCSFSHGLIWFFQRPADGLVRDRRDDLQADEFVGEQLHRPGGAAVGRRGAGQHDQLHLGPAVEHARPARPGLGLADEGGVESGLDEPLADPRDRVRVYLDGLGDRVVGPGRSAVGGVGLEEYAGVDELLGGRRAGRDRRPEVKAFVRGQSHFELRHGILRELLHKNASPHQAQDKKWRPSRPLPAMARNPARDCLCTG